MNINKKLSKKEMNILEEFLLSEHVPKRCMVFEELDGFLTSIVIGPETIMPSIWLGEIWGEENDDEMIWDSDEKMMEITELILRQYQSIVSVFNENKNYFEPVLSFDGKSEIISFWAIGFYRGISLNLPAWKVLMEDEDYVDILLPIVIYGSELGYKELENSKELQKISHEKWVEMLVNSVLEIYNYWIPFRKEMPQTHVNPIPKIGRNDPCLCGSGKKFKRCCLGKIPNA